VCGSHKLVNALPGVVIEPPKKPIVCDPSRPWYWEGNVQARLAAWLESQGCRVLSQADTASKRQGPDICALESSGEKLLISVKGYPERRKDKRTQPATQARHWFAEAIFDALLHRDNTPGANIAVAFPDFRKTYRSLAARMRWLRDNLPLRIYWVAESGEVSAE
jgi:hypothetical protein